MILRNALLSEAHRMGLEVSNQELASALRSIPYLYQNGQFIGMAEYESLIQQETGMSVAQFETQMRSSILLRKLRQAVTDDVQVTPEEVQAAFRRQNEKARINYVLFEPSDFTSAVQIKPQALAAYFMQNRLKYKLPEQRKVKYIIIPTDAVRSQVKVTQAQIEQYYNAHLSTYQLPDRVKAAHILFKTTGETPQQQAETLKTAQSVLAQVKAGANFADLAKKYSQDTASAARGGELGWIERGQTVKAFEDAAFSMKPGTISDLIRTEYGYHIIKVEDRQTAHLQTLAEVKDSIEKTLEKQDLEAAQQALAGKIQDELKANPHDFDAIARQNGVQSGETPLFSYNQAVPDLGNNASFENLAFQLPVDTIGEPISVPKGAALIMVTEIVPEHLPKLSEVQSRVEQDYRADQAKILSGEKARSFAQQAKNGNFAKLAKADGYAVKQSKDFTSQDQLADMIPASSLSSAFTLQPGQTSNAIGIGATYVVFQVVSHTPASEADFSAQKSNLATQLLQEKRDLAFEIYSENLKQQLIKSGKLKINDSAMKQFLSGYQESS
ncbi:MAG: peptidylprolyl isomerase, partial [Terriglobia bacterium]